MISLLLLIAILPYLFSIYLSSQSNFLYPLIASVQSTQLPYIFFQAILLIIGAVVASFIILLFIIKNKLALLGYLIVSLLGFSLFYVILFYFFPLFESSSFKSFMLAVFMSILISSLLTYGAFYSKGKLYHPSALILMACSIGALLGNIFNFLQISIILILFSIYDIISVFFGPIGKISKELNQSAHYFESISNEEFGSNIFLNGMFFRVENIEIGIGDLVFYSMMVANISIQGALYYMLVLIGLITGLFITIYFTRKYSIFPGLPIPILISLALIWFFIYF